MRAVGMTAEGGTFENVSVSGAVNATSGILSNIIINGSSTFNGDIISGPLELTSNVPTSNQVIISAGTYKNVNDIPVITGVSGSYGAINFYKAVLSGYITTPSYKGQQLYSYARLLLYNQQGTLIYRNEYKSKVSSSSSPILYRFDYNFSYRYIYSQNTKTFKLNNLPTNEPAERGVVWIDGNTLKIKT